MKTIVLTLCLSLPAAFAGNVANGKKLYKKINCTMCHKKDGSGKAKMKGGKPKITSVMSGPRIAGLSEKYILAQMLAVQSGKRKGKSSTMRTKIKKYTEADFKDIAAYVSKKLNPKLGKHKGMLE